MNIWGKKSKRVIETLHPTWKQILEVVLQRIDISAVEGRRTPEYQFGLYKKGRELIDGVWEVVGKTVTDKDGYEKLSVHQTDPSKAVDVLTAGSGYADIKAAIYLGSLIVNVAWMMGHEVRWGGDWDRDQDMTDQNFMDYWHFELVLKDS